MKELLDQWMQLKNQEREAKEAREQIEVQLYMNLEKEMNSESQATWNFDNYKLVIKPNYSVKVDQDQASLYPSLFKTKYEMSYSQYKKSEQKSVIDEIVTVSQSKPTFTVEIK